MATIFEGGPSGAGLRIAIVVARWNDLITRQLLLGARETLVRLGVAAGDIDVAWVPGSLEIPQAARWLAGTGRYDALIALGAVIRGGTPHFEHVSNAAYGGLVQVAAATDVPLATGILTVDTSEQALERSGIKGGNKGAEAAQAAVEMANLRRLIADSAAAGGTRGTAGAPHSNQTAS